MLCEMKLRLWWLRVSVPGWILHFRFSHYKVGYFLSLVFFHFILLPSSAFQAPGSPAGMQALLEHSVQSYHPLPSELRSRRVRTSSRSSPYPQSRVSKMTLSPDQTRSSNVEVQQPPPLATPVLQQVHINQNIMPTAPSLDVLKTFSPLCMDIEPKRENAYGLAPAARPRVPSVTRRSALGWSKRSSGKSSTDQKENVVGQGAAMTYVSFFLLVFIK